MTKRRIPTIVAAAALSGLAGCSMFDTITETTTYEHNRNTTIGRELVDLREARDRHAISEEEYAKAKEKILKGGPDRVAKSGPGTK
ncbi:MAG: SHOCT domain-containing protein [Kiritimatiellae bacterium]|nr:SHOCT domain-containing protein [Kiritimatiellia bacterium]